VFASAAIPKFCDSVRANEAPASINLLRLI
jgi:hypothetical protein